MTTLQFVIELGIGVASVLSLVFHQLHSTKAAALAKDVDSVKSTLQSLEGAKK